MNIQESRKFCSDDGGISAGDEGTKREQQLTSLEVEFPPGHDMCRLRALWLGTEGQGHAMRLNIWPDEFGPAPIAGKSQFREKERLEILLTYTAHMRAKQIFDGAAEGSQVQIDEEAYVFLSEDEMAAWLFLFPPVGEGRRLTNAQLCQMMDEYKIKYGVNWDFLMKLPEPPHRWFRLFPVACGKAPIPGRDGSIVDHYPRSLREEVQVDELAKADYMTLKLVQDIDEGDIICEIIAPEAGISGCTVTGRSLPAPAGREAVVPKGRNTRLSDDGRYLVAGQRGHVAFSGRSFQVKSVLELSEKEALSQQNIKFLGDIHIHGDLTGGSYVCALGTVQVDGAIEDSTVEAGEHIIVSSGVQGQDRAVLHAQKSVYAKYLEHCSVYARESVQADCIINCNVYSNGTVRARTGRGVIIGGTVMAAREVSAVTVGSKAERPTGIVLGGQPCEEAERLQVMAEIAELERHISDAGGQAAGDEDKKALPKLRLNLCVARMKLDKIDKDLGEHMQPACGDDTPRLVCDTAYPGTAVTIGRHIFHASQVEENCVVGLVGGTIGRLEGG